jgi:translation initiation factor IF-2
MSSKLRVYEVARELSLDNKEIVSLLQSMGFGEVRNHMSVVSSEAVERLRRHQERKAEPKLVEERIRPTVVKRRSVPKPVEVAAPQPEPPPVVAPVRHVRAGTPVHHVKPVAAPPPAEPEKVAVSAEPVEALPRHPGPVGEVKLPPIVEVEASKVASPPVAASHEPVQSVQPEPAVVPAAEVKVETSEVPAPVAHAPVAHVPVAVTHHSEPTQEVVRDAGGETVVSHQEPPKADVAVAETLEAKGAGEVVPAPVSPPVMPVAGPPGATRAARPGASAAPATTASRPSSPPRTGIEVWEGRPGVPMTPPHRGPVPRRVQYDAKAGAGNLQRRPGQPAPRQAQRGTRGRTTGPLSLAAQGGKGVRPSVPPQATERGAHKRVVKIESSIGLQTLAGRMGIKAHELLRKLIMLGMTGVNINSTLDADTAKIVASEFGWEVEDVAVTEEEALVLAQRGEAPEEEAEARFPRPPVVTVMGHVDHGKTSLLDRIRKANVVAGEAGGITQHIGAYSVDTPAGGKVTFLDTPGHAAFTAMRARGAKTTDIIVLVVAADDGVMPQTREAITHAKNARVPIVVAINKCDKPEAQPDRVRRELSEFGLMPEEWGGETLFTEVSAQTGAGVDVLLERIMLQSEMMDLRANPNKPAVGVVIEAQLDRGRGPVATVLITDGTLNRGDVVLAGAGYGKVRAILDSYGHNCATAGPSTPIEVIGLNDVPAAGDPVHVIKDMKKAQEIADTRKTKERRSLMPSVGPRLTLEDLYKAMKETEQLELKVIVKGDVQGSVEAVSDALMRLSTEKVKVTVVHAAAGAITEGDVNLAVAAGSIIIGFNVRPAGKAASLAAQEKVEIRHYTIIYNVVDDVKAAMEGLLAPSYIEKVTGKAEVRQVFRISKAGNVAGCMVIEGVIKRSGSVRVLRDNATVWQGKLSSLKRFKDDAREVKEGFDCGISLEGYQDLKEQDILEGFEVEEVRQSL